MNDVTRILSRIEQGDPHASEQLLPLVYAELRRLAAHQLRGEPTGNTLQPTALVHEAYLRLVDQQDSPRWSHKGHFFAAAAEAMRRILVESARRKQAQKRGGDRQRVALDEAELVTPGREAELLALDEALSLLADQRPELARLVSLRYFAGLTMKQAAEAMGTSPRNAERHWTYAKAWLKEAIRGDD